MTLQRRSTPNDAKNGSTSDQSDPRREKPTCAERPTDARFVIIAGKPTMSTAVARTGSWGYAASTPMTRDHATASDPETSTNTSAGRHPRGRLPVAVSDRRHPTAQRRLYADPAVRACRPSPLVGETKCGNAGRWYCR